MDKVIALMQGGGQCATELDFWIRETGITHVFWYIPENDDLTLFSPGYVPFQFGRMRASQAQKIQDGIAAQGKDYVLRFDDQTVHDAEQPTGNTVSYFSTFGPTVEMSMKPQLAAPGGNILSTWVTSDGLGYVCDEEAMAE
jgi:hypothetical protein